MKKNLIFLVVLISVLQSIVKGQESFSFSLENDPDTIYHRISKLGNQILRTTVEEYTVDNSCISGESLLEAKLIIEKIDSTIFFVPKDLLDITNQEVQELLLGGFLIRRDFKYVSNSWEFVSGSYENIFQLKDKTVSFVSRKINGYLTFWKHVFFFLFCFSILKCIFGKKEWRLIFFFFGFLIILFILLAYFIAHWPSGIWEWIDGINLLGILGMIILFLRKRKEVKEIKYLKIA